MPERLEYEPARLRKRNSVSMEFVVALALVIVAWLVVTSIYDFSH